MSSEWDFCCQKYREWAGADAKRLASEMNDWYRLTRALEISLEVLAHDPSARFFLSPHPVYKFSLETCTRSKESVFGIGAERLGLRWVFEKSQKSLASVSVFGRHRDKNCIEIWTIDVKL